VTFTDASSLGIERFTEKACPARVAGWKPVFGFEARLQKETEHFIVFVKQRNALEQRAQKWNRFCA